MAEYIDREALERFIRKEFSHLAGLLNYIRIHCPTADVVEVRHGKWRKRGNEKTCSKCKFIYYSNNDDWNYCPNCGAKVVEE